MKKEHISAIITSLIGILLISGALVIARKAYRGEPTFTLHARPPGEELVFDYAGIMEDYKESVNGYLESIKKRHSIEGVIVTVASTEEAMTVEELAVAIFNNWKIGKDTDGRGVLLLLLADQKQVKVEVALELEDVFTDMFCGYIEDIQLRPYFFSGDLGLGMVAVMEELENRAQIKQRGEYTKSFIAGLDEELLSGGAGAKRDLAKFQKETVEAVGSQYPAGKTPTEAWNTLIRAWRDKVRDPNIGVYSDLTKLAFRGYTNSPDSRFEKDYKTYFGKSFEVLSDGTYAVIYFGKKKGWENSPWLMHNSPEGWMFDIVSQRKYVRFGPSPTWAVEITDHPYVNLLNRCPYYTGIDMPLGREDIYYAHQDKEYAARIVALEARYAENPNDFDVAMELGRLKTITAMRPQEVFSVLKKAKQLNPQSSQPYKYIAIRHVDANFQYKTAMPEIKEYIKREPKNPFGYKFLGFLHYQLKEFEQAVKQFKKAQEIEPNSLYTFCKLSRCYAELSSGRATLDPRKEIDKNLALEMLEKAKTLSYQGPGRVRLLQRFLKKKKIITQ
ncbi:TPM domain-containing protein [Candidatus Omnitrophota bacterium]